MPKRHAPLRYRSILPVIPLFFPVIFLLGLGAGYLIWGKQAGTSAGGEQQIQRLDVSDDGDPSIGPSDAPVTIIEFGDYQCGYCALWNQRVFDQLLANYPTQVRFVYRDLPITGHTEALPAAEAANCAGEQGAYWQYHNALFSGKYNLGRSAYEQYATELGLNLQSFITCLESRRYQEEVQADFQDARRAGINSTPTFLINGRLFVGAQSFANFQIVIEEELAAQRRR